ncbi:MAG TPA: type IV toxin-antitoxin system AbiEi family antitoxin domain-containing protein [Solirubrobacteraceae bacterium]|nr:type IV toxin-antitoxin system AbiEi family antitoxin domain-containing protein [Solirubrobacteraceae bacterium]
MPPRGFLPDDHSRARAWEETHARGRKVPNRRDASDGWEETHTGDAAIAALAARQQGVVTTAQLAAAGIAERAVAHRVANGRLCRVFRGVYRVGPITAPYGIEMAAVLATGGALSHHTAAALWGVRPPSDGEIHVMVTGTAKSRRGLRVHRTRSLDAAVHLGLPLTTVPRTLHDLAPRLSQGELERAVEEAVIRGLAKPEQLASRPALRRATIEEPQITRSEAERRLRRLIRAARLPRALTNTRVAGWEVDALWPRERLVVEVDGFAYHGNRAAFERDRRKDAALVAAGYRVVRITWRQLVDEPHVVVALLARLLPPLAA